MGKKGAGGKGSGRGRSSGGGYSPSLNTNHSPATMARKSRAIKESEAQAITDMMRHAPAKKAGPKLKPLGKADSKAVAKAQSAKRPTKAQRELALAASVRKTVAKNNRRAARG